MKRSIPNPETTSAPPSEANVVRRSLTHVEPFNGSDAMFSIRISVEERKAVAPHQAIFTVREAGHSAPLRTIAIPLFL